MIVVTGGSGYLGSILMPNLSNALILDIKTGYDIRSPPSLKDVTTLIHLAALRDFECNKDPEQARSVNVQGTKAVLEAAEKSGVERIVFASSCSVYGRRDGFVDERSPPEPTSIYGQTKAEAEQAVLNSRIPRKVVLRFATLFGASPNMRFDTLFNQFVFEAVHDGRLKVFEPDAWRPLLHVKDAAHAIRTAPDGLWNVGHGNYRKAVLAGMVRSTFSVPLEIDQRVKDQRSYRVRFSIRGTKGPESSIEEISDSI